jgi:hypothetical protein
MKAIFERKYCAPPKLSIVLLDWSCRESFHMLGYLAEQTVPRAEYEVIWIEYYQRRAEAIARAVASEDGHRVDQWIVIGMPDNLYYHKHLMYNVGLVVSRGAIVALCDSGMMVKPTFVESILREFERCPDIVLHLDEVRKNDRRSYPFNHPSFEGVVGACAINRADHTTTGLVDRVDLPQNRNYGACMAARREDLIAIGGADEHIDYLGQSRAPYELTFRLVNAGKREVWHPSEFLYHTWQPGQASDKNDLGPQDGPHMSTTALAVRRTQRITPLVENPAIQALRLGPNKVRFVPILDMVIPEAETQMWTVEHTRRLQTGESKRTLRPWDPRVVVPILRVVARVLVQQMWLKTTQLSRRSASIDERLTKALRAYRFVRGALEHHRDVIRRAKLGLEQVRCEGVDEVAIIGSSEVAEILVALARVYPVRVAAVYDELRRGRFLRFTIQPLENVADYHGKVVVAAVVGVDEKLRQLRSLGIKDSHIVLLG